LADVSVMKGNLRMPHAGESDHFGGDVEAFRLKAMLEQQVQHPAFAAAADIEGGATIFDELDRAFVGSDAVGLVGKVLPLAGDLIVAEADGGGVHGGEGLQARR